MSYSVEWNLIRSPGIVLVGKQFDASESAKEVHKVALIDLNMTLMISKSGFLHGTDEHDWKWWHENVPLKLRKLHQEGYQVAIVSNQGRLTIGGKEAAEARPFKLKMESVMRELGIPTTVMVACANDICRKPRTGRWSLLRGPLRSTSIDTSQSFVVGDAAGRERDYSDIDRHFSMNLGIDFYTPEVFFRGEPAEDLGHKFDPAWYLPGAEGNKSYPASFHDPFTNNIIVFIGLPGAGKTSYYRRFLAPHGYERVAQVAGISPDTCLNAAHEFLAQGKPVVVDDINIDTKSRKVWLSLAQNHGLQARALHFTTPTELCLHNDSFRALGVVKFNPEQKPIYPRIPFLGLVSCYESPTVGEGFESVTDVDFEWHGTDEDLVIWKRYWH